MRRPAPLAPRVPLAALVAVVTLGPLAPFAAAPLAADYPPPVPSALWLDVRETAGVARTGELVRSGVPLARELGVTDAADLAVVDSAGALVPAQFHVLARWHAPLGDGSAPIQWVLVAFRASVAADGRARYRLVIDGSAGPNPPPTAPLVLTPGGGTWTIDTGAARFTIGGAGGALFDAVRRGDGTLLASGVGGSVQVGATTYPHTAVQSVAFERSGPLYAVAVVRSGYTMPPVGGGGLVAERRYEFTAGSPTALVRQSIAWQGDRCGIDQRVCAGTPNGVQLARAREPLDLQLGFPVALTAVGAFAAPATLGAAQATDTAAVRQLQRVDRFAPLAFSVAVPGAGASGTRADGGVLAASGGAGAVAVALERMDRFEPQALRLLANGRLALDLIDAPIWLANRQGLYAELAVAALPPAPTRADLDRRVWAPLQRPLRAWPRADAWAASRAVEEIPVGPLSAPYAGYDPLVRGVLDTTLSRVDSVGTSGLMTYGVFPRNWGNPIYADEVDCGPDDPTPADDSDDTFWCGVWTDYHNASTAAFARAARTGEVEWLDDVAEPAARRVLHTQIPQCSAADPYFGCGQAPVGYGAYRLDNNGSHSYFDNLLLYYWTTGDATVVRTLLRGAASMRLYLCPTRGTPPGPACDADEPISDEWAAVNGRVAVQWLRVFRFLGLAADASFLDDAGSSLARALTQYYAQPGAGAGARGFVVPSGGGSTAYVDGPGTYGTTQPWMDALYDLDFVARWRLDTANAPLGLPPLAPSAVEIAWARTMLEIASLTPFSTGGPDGPWPNGVTFEFAGARVGGTLVDLVGEVDADGDGNPCELCDDDGDGDPGTCFDVCLYDDGKSALAGPLARAAELSDDDALWDLATAHAVWGIETTPATLPLSKVTGIALARLHAAVARVSARDLIFRDGFDAGDELAWSSTGP